MKVSRNWLQKYFNESLPEAQMLADRLTFHAFEIEEIIPQGDDAIIDVKVTPNRGHDALCHRGIVKEISVITEQTLTHDPLREIVALEPKTNELVAEIEDSQLCRRFSAAVITGVKVGPSPEWLKSALEAIGQRSINNIVDATNYVMFDLGQPLHAFDADKLTATEGKRKLSVKTAPEGSVFTALDGKEYTATGRDLFVTDGNSGALLGIAGVKGGKAAELTDATTTIVLEAANFAGVSVRKTSQRFKLRTDASVRFENEISAELTAYGLKAVVDLILELSPGEFKGFVDVYPQKSEPVQVSISLEQINAYLDLAITHEDVSDILGRFGFEFKDAGEVFTVEIPFERLDLRIKEDLIEEIGRIYGYGKIQPVAPSVQKPSGINKRFYYAEKVRGFLLERGFSEVYTSSFRDIGSVELANALASDKNFLRQNLTQNLAGALKLNGVNAPFLGLTAVNIFEIGTVFDGDKEIYALGFASWMGEGSKKENSAKIFIEETKAELEKILGLTVMGVATGTVFETDLGSLLGQLPDPKAYENLEVRLTDSIYKPFSSYPFMLRDIALWVPSQVAQGVIETIIRSEAGELLVRLDHFDSFEKEGQVSHAFHLVFQSYDRTLSDMEINGVMEKVVAKLESNEGWKVR